MAQDRLQRLDDDRILLTLKTAWSDGTRHLLFTPMELLEKLAALTPRPRINLVLYHGVLAPHARWRALVVPHGAPLAGPVSAGDLADESSDAQTAHVAPRHWAWARLMRRAFDIDVLVCPRCGGQLRLIATVEDPGAVRATLTGLEFGVEASARASPPVAASAAN